MIAGCDHNRRDFVNAKAGILGASPAVLARRAGSGRHFQFPSSAQHLHSQTATSEFAKLSSP